MTLDVDYLTNWDEYHLKYTHFKQQFIEVSTPYISSMSLMTLKTKYDGIINSKREADRIKDLCGLLKILENRAVLNYNKIEPLKYIGCEFIKDAVLNRIIHEYEMSIQSQLILPLFNVYQYRCSIASPTSSTVPKPIRILTNENRDTTTYSGAHSHQVVRQALSSHETPSTLFDSEQQKKIFKQLSKDLDRYWRDLARFLDVTESEIDEIDRNTNFQLHDKAFKTLEIFGNRSDPCTWRVKLIQALKDVRRRDLTEVVNVISNTSR